MPRPARYYMPPVTARAASLPVGGVACLGFQAFLCRLNLQGEVPKAKEAVAAKKVRFLELRKTALEKKVRRNWIFRRPFRIRNSEPAAAAASTNVE